ncbi:MAG: response regulator [Proteobacteria bacterium]|nr:response regulator [Pseudomonadota bacterium]MBU1649631.1 response regulator [Pseudomonadota bacterium]
MVKTILVVEDNEKNMILMRDVLQYYGYVVITALNGEEGVHMAREHQPDLTFMDIQMPVMDGYTAIKIVRNDPDLQDMKIVALTSFAMSGDRELLLAAGFDGYLAKPLDIRQLPGIISKYLGEKQESPSLQASSGAVKRAASKSRE